MMKKILDKLNRKNSKIGIIGQGYVGLPLTIRFAQENFLVTGFDIDKIKIDLLNQGKSYFNHIENKDIAQIIKDGFTATNDFKTISNMDIVIICVPTPLGKHNEPDLSFINDTLVNIGPHLRESQLLVLESTTYPGTTEEVILPFIKSLEKKFNVGQNFYIGYSPEREDPGNKNFSTKTIPKIVSGITTNCLKYVNQLYSKIIDVTVPVSSPKIAEMTKIFENIHRAVNIGLVNELKIVSDKMGLDLYEVIDAASTKPFGFTPYFPGPGLGGHCIPIDPFYLTWKAKEYGMNTRFIELAGEINTSMPNFVIQKVGFVLNKHGKSFKGSKLLVLGLSYKKNIDDLRESPSLKLIDELISNGSKVEFSDPYFKEIPQTRKHKLDLKGKELSPKVLKSADLVILATDHDLFDYKMIKENSKIIVDTRGRFRKSKNIIRA